MGYSRKGLSLNSKGNKYKIMLDGIKDRTKNLVFGCFCAILELLISIVFFVIIGIAFNWWYFVLGTVIILIITGYMYSKYKIQIKCKLANLDKSKLTYPIMSIMLIGCLCDMPYEYYMLIRLIAMGMFAYWAYCYYQKDEDKLTFLFTHY